MAVMDSIQVPIEPELKCEVEAILAALGVTPAEAITLF